MCLLSCLSVCASVNTPLRGEIYFGKASWYGKKFHGKKTSSGEKFNRHELTAAHNFLPFGSIVKVTNLLNDKSVEVCINDRGPYKKNRIIDLSEKAAELIDLKEKGVANVKIQVLKRVSELASKDKNTLLPKADPPLVGSLYD